MKSNLDSFFNMPPEPTAFVELCAGTAAVSFALMGYEGYHYPPYMGAKYRWAPYILSLMDVKHSTNIHLNDIGPWSIVWQTLKDPINRSVVSQSLRESYNLLGNEDDPNRLYRDMLATKLIPYDPVLFTSTFIHLQWANYMGIPVTIKDHQWKISAFNNIGFTRKLGIFAGQRSSLGRIAERIDRMSILDLHSITVSNLSAEEIIPIPGSICYIDPPYASTAGYHKQDLTRDQVISIALSWSQSGASVYISEAEPILLLINQGWQSVDITDHTRGSSNNMRQKKRREYLTYYKHPS